MYSRVCSNGLQKYALTVFVLVCLNLGGWRGCSPDSRYSARCQNMVAGDCSGCVCGPAGDSGGRADCV